MLTSRPIKNIQEVLNWNPTKDSIYKTTSYKPNRWKIKNGRKTLLCHDMKGGYLEGESSLEGVQNDAEYLFWHWWQIDIFVYFSHFLITIPPQPWVEAAHKHGVKILGTLITEWESGSQICSKILESDESAQQFAHKLVEISLYYNFDGWLLNIENDLSLQDTKSMVNFVEYLTKKQHEAKESCEVLWYDSVTLDGKLVWQNELNQLNLDFFKVCDGIFLNYTWTEENLDASKQSCLQADRTLTDVYVGVDVFARNCIGGFDSYKSVELISSKGLSTALFAPSWTHEKFKGVEFEENEARFWSSLESSFTRRKLRTLPLVSTFNRGHGKQYSSFGTVLLLSPWFNLCMQSLQSLSCEGVSVDGKGSFIGGGPVKLSPKQGSQINLFNLDVEVESNECLYVSFVSRLTSSDPPCSLAITLTVSSLKEGTQSVLKFWDSCKSQPQGKTDDLNIEQIENTSFIEKIKTTGWCGSFYKYRINEPVKLEEVGVHVEDEQGVCSSASLGYLQISKEDLCYLSIIETCEVSLSRNENETWEVSTKYSLDKFNSFKVVREEINSGEINKPGDEITADDLKIGYFLFWDFNGVIFESCIRVFDVFVKESNGQWTFLSFTPTTVFRLDQLFNTDNRKELIIRIESHVF